MFALELLGATLRGLIFGVALGAMAGAFAWIQVAAFWGPLGVPELWNTISVVAIAAIAGGYGFWIGASGRDF